jgi:glycosyltransferase involved in cell wall biosynthesis
MSSKLGESSTVRRRNNMRVLVDNSAAFNQGAGIGRFARNILPAAARLMPDSTFSLLYAPSYRGPSPYQTDVVEAFPDPGSITVTRLPFGRRRADQLWFRAGLPLRAQWFAGKADVAFSPDFTMPPVGNVPRAITIHDLAFEIFPDKTSPALKKYLSAIVPKQVQQATRVLAVSETTKQDLIERLGVDESLISIVPNGVDEQFFQTDPLPPERRQALGLPNDYLLIVGTLEPRKNHLNLFKAIEILDRRVDLPLVVAGRRGWDDDEILSEANSLAAKGRVILTDYVADKDLPGLYAGARAVVYPSWYEGFGLPVAEAMASGAAVVTSSAPALRETGGEAALYCDPGDPECIAERIVNALGEQSQSEEARVARRARAREFSWDRSGIALAGVLQQLEAERTGSR